MKKDAIADPVFGETTRYKKDKVVDKKFSILTVSTPPVDAEVSNEK